MFRHPHYLEVPWDIRGHPVTTRPHQLSVVADRAASSARHVSDRRRRHEGNHLVAPAGRSTAGRGSRSVSDFQEP